MSKDQKAVCLILTATVDPSGISFMKRTDKDQRYRDYKQALAKWLGTDCLDGIIFCENSGADLSELEDMATTAGGTKTEFLSFYGQDFPRSRGKGYGEMLTLKYILEHSSMIDKWENSFLIKVNGRYFVKNIYLLSHFLRNNPDLDAVCTFRENLRYSDSQVFAGSRYFFLNYLFPLSENIDDTGGVFFEHVLARAVHLGLSQDRKWSLPPVVPDIEGFMGTSNTSLKLSPMKKISCSIKHKLRQHIYST